MARVENRASTRAFSFGAQVSRLLADIEHMKKIIDFDVWNEEWDETGSFHIDNGIPASVLKGSDLISTRKSIEVKFDYPLGSAPTFVLRRRAGAKGITRRVFAAFEQRTYRKIYANEDRYGIWGHNIGDLVLEGAEERKASPEEGAAAFCD